MRHLANFLRHNRPADYNSSSELFAFPRRRSCFASRLKPPCEGLHSPKTRSARQPGLPHLTNYRLFTAALASMRILNTRTRIDLIGLNTCLRETDCPHFLRLFWHCRQITFQPDNRCTLQLFCSVPRGSLAARSGSDSASARCRFACSIVDGLISNLDEEDDDDR